MTTRGFPVLLVQKTKFLAHSRVVETVISHVTRVFDRQAAIEATLISLL